jgi:branched-subunit amino acid aminotransferase/4-amino-4-deoxychorismate lyase
MTDRAMWIYQDGRYARVPEKMFETARPGNVPGRGAFESLVVTGGRIWAWAAHRRRLERALRLMNVPCPGPMKALEAAVLRVVERNRWSRARARLCVWKQQGAARASVMAVPLRLPSRAEYEAGWPVGWSSYRREPGRLSAVKTLDYQLFHAARREALERGWKEGILLNSRGEVVEAAHANVFCVTDGVVLTPPVASGCLNGVTRRIVLNLARGAELKTRVAVLSRRDLRTADEIFLTNSVIGVMPCVRLSSQPVGSGRPGPAARCLLDEYRRAMPGRCPV